MFHLNTRTQSTKYFLMIDEHLMTKPTKWPVHPAKTHLPSLIRVFAVCMKKHWALNYLLSVQWRLWSDWADAQADLSLCLANMSFCWFCHAAAQMIQFLSRLGIIIFHKRFYSESLIILLDFFRYSSFLHQDKLPNLHIYIQPHSPFPYPVSYVFSGTDEVGIWW